jgi:hypothetical protein
MRSSWDSITSGALYHASQSFGAVVILTQKAALTL